MYQTFHAKIMKFNQKQLSVFPPAAMFVRFVPLLSLFVAFLLSDKSSDKGGHKRKRGALTRASLSIHHIMLTIKCYYIFLSN